jgi:hypothetical protein
VGLGSFNVYDNAFPTTKPDTSTAARASAVALEIQIRSDANETGAFIARDGSIIVQKTGSPSSVSFSSTELIGTHGTLFTHNHPDDGPFSREDIVAAIKSQLVEVRVVGPTLRYIVAARGGWPPIVALDRAIAKAIPIANQETRQQVRLGQLHPQHVDLEVCHQLWLDVARTLSLQYMREKS